MPRSSTWVFEALCTPSVLQLRFGVIWFLFALAPVDRGHIKRNHSILDNEIQHFADRWLKSKGKEFFSYDFEKWVLVYKNVFIVTRTMFENDYVILFNIFVYAFWNLFHLLMRGEGITFQLTFVKCLIIRFISYCNLFSYAKIMIAKTSICLITT